MDIVNRQKIDGLIQDTSNLDPAPPDLSVLDPTIIELSRAALVNNIRFIKSRLGPGVTFSSVIKGNAYGHGIEPFLPMAEDCGIRHFSVFSTAEAAIAANVRTKPDTHIMIMGGVPENALEWVVEHEISFYVFEKSRLKMAKDAAEIVGKRALVHLQLETGMNRLGFETAEYDEITRYLNRYASFLKVSGICTHFAGAESVANYVRIQEQKERFEKAVRYFRKKLPGDIHIHAASSAALLAYPETIYNMVRVGIAQYGYWPSREIYMLLKKKDRQRGDDPLIRLLRWKSWVMSIKDVDEGEFVGYGNTHMTNRKERIAVIPIGYSYGFGRDLSNTGYVLVRGERAKVVGIVNMNMLTIDVTDIKGVEIGDEVVIVGRQGSQEISLASFGELTNNLNYEVLSRLPEHLARVII